MSAWIDFLTEHGAAADGDVVTSFGDPAGELAEATRGTVLCDLMPFSALRASGPDAASFLHGQLTSDVMALARGATQYAAWCSPKGRTLANFVVRRIDDTTFELMLPAALLESIRKRLGMFVLRSQVAIEDSSASTVRFGVGGNGAADVVRMAFGALPALHRSAATAEAAAIALPGGRYVVFAQPSAARALWERLSAHARPSGFPVWQWLTIRAGVPVITPATADQFVPQAVNLDALDGVSFRKGCYTGQEIVARTRYLGRIKERLVLAHVDGAPPQAGARLYSPAFQVQACGTVVTAAAAPGGGSDLLAVLQNAARDSGDVRADGPDGRRLALLPLPYALPDAVPPRGRIA